ncbi:ferrochelatase [Nitratiruptor sp. SB155-2]|uniref:Ferrochelatase n=1 Tax=Nitratiruptor sp. (strain SB155-2) TaxID=387092 RepID=HEMH_NITSB|nr:ferrochelatase [Nitratiruptor sp. SB155-2]A6Q2Y9.1 RecName: Full=Ferrochelatase; AltName: Full=Heme synthase; AltName: Full=Protoheme ferro-lyase [Nitratiruptor sp. SB155-2]BAF69848.1 ferrochelatase [Nitratiruptor sp. SB155-2]
MKAIVLLNMGGPNNLEEVELFLRNMFNDKNILPIRNDLLRKFVAYMITQGRKKEARSNYEKLGGKSPLNFYTDRLIAKLQKRLPDVYVTKAMRYTPPFAKEAIKELMYHNVREVFLIPLYPHYSTTTTKSSLEDFYNMAKGVGYHARFHDIANFYENRLYNQAIIERIEEALDGEDTKEYELVFSAHSLPQKIIEKGDPYLQEVQEHVKILTSILEEKFSGYHLAFQSKLGPVKWLEPGLDEKLEELKGKKILVYPISFTLDNSETEFELHIEYAQIAQKIGVKKYKVARCPNESDRFVDALVDIYQRM